MAAATGQESNLTSIRYAVESSQGVLPGSPEWVLLEPNTEPRFGVELTTVERNVIDDDRMTDPGSIVDKNPGVQIEQDFTLDNQMVPLQSFMFAALSGKGQVAAITGVTAADDTFARGSGLDIFAADDLVLARGFSEPANNGLHLVSSAASGALVVTSALVDETPPAGATLTKVGHQYAAADVTVDASGARPKLVTAAGDFRDLDLEVGEAIYVGGDATANQFATAANNGEKRVFAVAADGSEIELDESFADMVTDASATGKSIRIFVGFNLKNKKPGDGFARTFIQLERTLGAPDEALPAQIQSEYVVGAIGSEYALEVPAQNKVTSTMTFLGQSYETRDGATGVKSGTRTDLLPSDAINTSSDMKKLIVSPLPTADEAPTPLFGLIREMSLNVNDNIGRRTALGVVGAARFGVGQFHVTGSLNAYFVAVDSLDSIQNYDKFTIHGFFATAANSGFSFDMPVVTLKTDGADVANNEDVMLQCDFTAHNGRTYDSSFDHALCWTFFPYLPTLARTVT